MLKWNQIPLGPLQTNCYVMEKAEKCVIVDPGGEGNKLIQYIQTKKWQPIAILLTHAHFDHIGAVDVIRDHYQIPVYLHEKEAKWLADADSKWLTIIYPREPNRNKASRSYDYNRI